MDTSKIKEEPIIDLVTTRHSQIEYSFAPNISERLNSALPSSCQFFFENTVGVDKLERVGNGEQDPIAVISQTVECSYVHDQKVALDTSSQMSVPFTVIKAEDVIDSKIKIEPSIPEDAGVLQNTKIELTRSEDIVAFSDIKILIRKNTELPKNEFSTSSIKEYSDASKLKLKAVTNVQYQDRDFGPRTLKNTCSSTAHETVKDRQDIVSKYELKPLTVNIGPRVHLPQCFLPTIKLKIYSCNKCSSKFTDSFAYNAHVHLCSIAKTDCLKQSPNFYRCGICIYKFKEMSNLQSHMMNHPCKNFSCNVCAEGFYSVDELRAHGDKVHKDKSIKKCYTCNVCGYSTIYYEQFKKHLIQHIPDRHLFCNRCRRNCEDESDYSKHCAKLHSNVVPRKIRKIASVQVHYEPVPDKKICKRTSTEDSFDIIENKHKGLTANDIILPVTNNKLNNLQSCESEIVLKDGMYHCSMCIYKFYKLANIKAHMKLHFDTESPYKCYECKYESFSVVEMENHCRTASHFQTSKCNVCSFEATEWRFMKRHAINHIYDGLFCRKCCLNYENYELCKEHMLVEHEIAMDNLFACKQCSYKHPNKPSYLKHVARIHLNKSKSYHKDTCKRLDKTKLGQNDINVNVSVLNEKRTLPKQTKGPYATLVESKNGHSEKNCYMSQSSGSSQRGHDRMLYNFKCAKCDLTTNKLKYFITHIKKHSSSEKPFQCNICFKNFALLKHYLKHMKLHNRALVYVCPFCNNYSSVNEVEFTKHAINHEFHSCPMCVYKTCNPRLFENHIVKQHTANPGAFPCPLCPYCTSELRKLGLHCLRFHPTNYLKMKLPIPTSLSLFDEHNNVFGCKLCKFTCKKSKTYDLKRHLLKHVTNGMMSKLNSKRLEYKKSKKPTFGLKKISKIKNTQSHNRDKTCCILYRCSKCNKKSKFWGTIYRHLQIQHKIVGGVRNNMIVKAQVRSPNLNDHEMGAMTNKVEQIKLTFNGSKSNNSSKGATNVHFENTLNKVALPSKYPNQCTYFCCSQCNMISRYLKSVSNHLKFIHNIPHGGIRNKLIYKMGRKSPIRKTEANDSKDPSAQLPKKIDLPLQQCNNDVERSNNQKNKTNHSIFYHCSQCDFKRHKRVLVYNHFRNCHKITGGLKNNNIFKIFAKLNENSQENTAIQKFNKSKFNGFQKTTTILNSSVCTSEQKNPIHKKSIKITKTSPKHDVYYHCSQCHFKTKNKNYFMVHLSRHHIDGAPKNNKVSKVINDQSKFVSNKRNRWISTSHNNMRRLDIPKHCVLEAQNDGELKTTNGCVDEKNIIPLSVSIDSGLFYFCVLCNYNYKNKLRQSLLDHILKFHIVENEEIRNRWIYHGSMTSIFNKEKECVISDQEDARNQANTQIKKNKMSKKAIPLYCSANDSPNTYVISQNRRRIQRKNSASFDDELNTVKTKCHLCNIHTLSGYAQMNHKSIGHTEFWKKPFFCKVQNCGVRYTEFSSLRRHEGKHKIPIFLCNMCDKYSTHQKDLLQKHQFSCSMKVASTPNSSLSDGNHSIANPLANIDAADNFDDENYSCGECDYLTLDATLFMKHMVTHLG